MARTRTASDQLVERLVEWGIDVVFGLPGDGINGVMEALRTHRDQIRFIHVRHEETAALAACAYGKFTGRPAACLATAAPGAVHLMNGLYDARIDQSPVVAITGMTYHDVIGTHYLQDINHDFALQDACVYSQRIMGERVLLPTVREASAQTIVATDGFSCRSQIEHGTDRSALHLAQLVQMALHDGPSGPSVPRPERRYAEQPA